MNPRTESAFTNTVAPLGDALLESFSRAERVDMAVSFLMETGLSKVMQALTDALERGATIRMVTGTYLGITSPFVLEELLRLEGDLEVHVFSGDVSYHPKAYIFHGPDCDEAFIGSSNLSRSALTEGVEWNYRLRRSLDPQSFDSFQAEFDRLFHRCSEPLTGEFLTEYRRDWKKPPIRSMPRKGVFEPRGPQISALNSLAATREDGMDRALLVMATGVGKTFVAAYDSRDYKRILFVAHRIEILNHARAVMASQ
ncbi:MAG: DEAD/DEAH box helicase family protein [Candidatus Methanomethylophilaceae archaeon]|nr:DEAD/DEAH box helicase family protein [Candidatus Methanomethylophilaceae archaeon]